MSYEDTIAKFVFGSIAAIETDRVDLIQRSTKARFKLLQSSSPKYEVTSKYGLETPSKAAQPTKNQKIRLAIAFVLSVIAFIASANFGIQYAVHALVVKQVHSTGMDWAHHIAARTPNMTEIAETESASNKQNSPDATKFTNMINGMLSVGNIYQIDVINPDCYCDISFGTYTARQSETVNASKLRSTLSFTLGDKTQQENSHNHGTSKALLPSKGAMKHIFLSEKSRKPHKPHTLFKHSPDRYPLDRAVAKGIATKLKHEIILHNSTDPMQPAKFAEVFHPVIADGKLSYIIRILVDVEEETATFTETLYFGAAIILMLLMIAFAYPATKFLHANRRQKKADKEAHFLANHDPMTKACNRKAFQEEAARVLQSSLANNQSAVIILFDIDKFKEVNDYHSYEAGDLIICALAEELNSVVPKGGQVARLGGDEFAIIIGGIDNADVDLEDVLKIPKNIQVAVNDNRQIITTGVSSGAVRYPQDGGNLEELMRNADLALHEAKATARGHTVEFNAQMGIEFYNRLDLEEEFRAGVEAAQIVPFYQPLIDLQSGQVIGFEALARWEHPTRGILTPYIFEELLADRVIGAKVGKLMLKKIIEDMKHWKASNIPFRTIGLNIGEGDLLEPAFALNVVSSLVKNGLEPSNLTIEVTETCMFGENGPAFVRQLEGLREAGCYISLDDFGTGFSSITQIKQLPCTSVKIDKSFVDDVVNDKVDQSIIQSLLELGKKIGYKLVLEGVETPEQLELLRTLECQTAQGYYFSRPIPASEVELVIEKINHSATNQDQIRIVA